MWTDRETHTTKLTVVFRGFAKAPKNEVFETNLSQYRFAHHLSLRSGTTETQNRAMAWTQL